MVFVFVRLRLGNERHHHVSCFLFSTSRMSLHHTKTKGIQNLRSSQQAVRIAACNADTHESLCAPLHFIQTPEAYLCSSHLTPALRHQLNNIRSLPLCNYYNHRILHVLHSALRPASSLPTPVCETDRLNLVDVQQTRQDRVDLHQRRGSRSMRLE
jgi:hypothetical protein